MGVAVDSSVLVRYFTKDDANLTERAEELFSKAKPNDLLLDRIIIAELGYVLKSVYGLKKSQIVAVYKSMLANNIFTIPERELVETAIELFDKENPLSFEDSWLLSLNHSRKVTSVLTFDDNLAKRLRVN